MKTHKVINFEIIILRISLFVLLILIAFSCSNAKPELLKSPYSTKSVTFVKTILKLDLDSLSKKELIKDLVGETYNYSNEDFHINYYHWCTFQSKIDTLFLKHGHTPADSLGKLFLRESFLKCIPTELQIKMKNEIENEDNQYIFKYLQPFIGVGDDIYTLHILIHNKALGKYFYAEKSGEFVDVPKFGIKINEIDLEDISFNPSKTSLHSKENIYFPKTGEIKFAVFDSTGKIDLKYKYEIDTILTDDNTKRKFLSWFFKVDSTLFNKQFLSKSQIDTIYYRYQPQSGNHDHRFKADWLFEDKFTSRYYYGHCYNYDSSGNRKNYLIYNILEKE